MNDQVEGTQPDVEVPPATKEQSGEPVSAPEVIETPALEPLVKGLQKGYTQTRQDISQINEKLDQLLTSGAKPEEVDEYVTKNSFKALLTEHEKDRIAENQKIQQSIQSAVTDLKDIGVVKSDAEADELMTYAVANKIPNLYSAAAKWQTDKAATAKDAATREAAATKAKQAEGAQIGTSQTTTTPESSGVPYAEIIKDRYR